MRQRPSKVVFWVGTRVLADLAVPVHQDLDATLAHAFRHLDRAFGKRFHQVVMSPETIPNPEGFKFHE